MPPLFREVPKYHAGFYWLGSLVKAALLLFAAPVVFVWRTAFPKKYLGNVSISDMFRTIYSMYVVKPLDDIKDLVVHGEPSNFFWGMDIEIARRLYWHIKKFVVRYPEKLKKYEDDGYQELNPKDIGDVLYWLRLVYNNETWLDLDTEEERMRFDRGKRFFVENLQVFWD